MPRVRCVRLPATQEFWNGIAVRLSQADWELAVVVIRRSTNLSLHRSLPLFHPPKTLLAVHPLFPSLLHTVHGLYL